MLSVVALVGRPNVGKSTLFNALTRSRDALVYDRPGVTRDRHYGVCRNGDKPFVLVDTGGLGDADELADFTRLQVDAAIAEASLVLFVVDAREGLLPDDRRILDSLRKREKRCILVVNKCDGVDEEAAQAEFSRLGLSEVVFTAATHRQGVDELLLAIMPHLPEESAETTLEVDVNRTRVAIIGRPNVGKSTLVNRLLGEERVIVSEVAGTTRDAIHVPIDRDGKRYLLIDTAGMRRRARVEDDVEKVSVIKTLQALDQANVAVVMIDASEGVTDQDSTVLGHALESGRALVIAVNKWDGLDRYQRERCRTELDRRLDYVPYAMRVFIAAKHGSGLGDLMKAVDRAAKASSREFSSSELTKAIEIAYESYQPPLVRGKVAKLRYAHQGGRNPPRIVIHGSRTKSLPESYKRYLENFLRKRFKLEGTPVRLDLRDGENPYEGKKNELSERQVKRRQRIIRHAKRAKR